MRICEICKKGSVTGGKRSFLRSHYNPTKKERKYPNLRKARLPGGEKALVCMRCFKKLHQTS